MKDEDKKTIPHFYKDLFNKIYLCIQIYHDLEPSFTLNNPGEGPTRFSCSSNTFSSFTKCIEY